jgi:hypothetical protein
MEMFQTPPCLLVSSFSLVPYFSLSLSRGQNTWVNSDIPFLLKEREREREKEREKETTSIKHFPHKMKSIHTSEQIEVYTTANKRKKQDKTQSRKRKRRRKKTKDPLLSFTPLYQMCERSREKREEKKGMDQRKVHFITFRCETKIKTN